MSLFGKAKKRELVAEDCLQMQMVGSGRSGACAVEEHSHAWKPFGDGGHVEWDRSLRLMCLGDDGEMHRQDRERVDQKFPFGSYLCGQLLHGAIRGTEEAGTCLHRSLVDGSSGGTYPRGVELNGRVKIAKGDASAFRFAKSRIVAACVGPRLELRFNKLFEGHHRDGAIFVSCHLPRHSHRLQSRHRSHRHHP